jgi:hypothetical protein
MKLGCFTTLYESKQHSLQWHHAHSHMTECTLYLAELWIGTAISNMPYSKPLLPMPKKHGSWVKDQGRQQCCYTMHKKGKLHMTRLNYVLHPLKNEILVCGIPIKSEYQTKGLSFYTFKNLHTGKCNIYQTRCSEIQNST